MSDIETQQQALNQKELELKARELALREKEIERREKAEQAAALKALRTQKVKHAAVETSSVAGRYLLKFIVGLLCAVVGMFIGAFLAGVVLRSYHSMLPGFFAVAGFFAGFRWVGRPKADAAHAEEDGKQPANGDSSS